MTAEERFAAHAREWNVTVQEIRTTETSRIGFGTRGGFTLGSLSANGLRGDGKPMPGTGWGGSITASAFFKDLSSFSATILLMAAPMMAP